MNAAANGSKRRWVWAALGAGAIVGGLAVLFSVSLSRPPIQVIAPSRPKPAIELAERREKSALDDEATLLDPTPLFQPTRWNTAQKEVKMPEAGGTFQSYRVPPKFDFADSDLKLGRAESTEVAAAKLRTSLDLPDPAKVPKTPADALAAQLPGPIAAGMGRTDAPVAAMPVYGAMVEIVAVGTGRPALPPQAAAQVQGLAAAAKPPSGRSWKAMEFVAAVDAAGLAAPLMITTRSGVDEVDAYFQNFVAQTLRLGERLAPGFYRISVGP